MQICEENMKIYTALVFLGILILDRVTFILPQTFVSKASAIGKNKLTPLKILTYLMKIQNNSSRSCAIN
jgi:hypothetical protein